MTDGSKLRRRTVLGSMAGLLVGPTASRAATTDPAATIPPSMTRQGAAANAHPYGQPSPHERGVVRTLPPEPGSTVALTPWQDLHGIVTPNGLHYVRDHAGTPTIDPATHRLMIHGLVEPTSRQSRKEMPAISPRRSVASTGSCRTCF